MPSTLARDGCRLRYEILMGKRSSSDAAANVTLIITLGGKSGVKEALPLARELCSVLSDTPIVLWDRRNTGESGIGFPAKSLFDQDVDDLSDIVKEMRIEKNIILYGSSSGARLAAMFALRHPNQVIGLILAPPTGSDSINQLKQLYFDDPLTALRERGIRAFADTSEYRGLCTASREALTITNPKEIEESFHITKKWMDRFRNDIMIGLTNNELLSLSGNKNMKIIVIHHGSVKDILHKLKTALDVALILDLDRIFLIKHLLKYSPDACSKIAQIVNEEFYFRSKSRL